MIADVCDLTVCGIFNIFWKNPKIVLGLMSKRTAANEIRLLKTRIDMVIVYCSRGTKT